MKAHTKVSGKKTTMRTCPKFFYSLALNPSEKLNWIIYIDIFFVICQNPRHTKQQHEIFLHVKRSEPMRRPYYFHSHVCGKQNFFFHFCFSKKAKATGYRSERPVRKRPFLTGGLPLRTNRRTRSCTHIYLTD